MPVHTLKAYVGGLEVQLHLSLTMALDRGEWLASRPGHFTPGKESQSPDPVWTFDAYVVSWLCVGDPDHKLVLQRPYLGHATPCGP